MKQRRRPQARKPRRKTNYLNTDETVFKSAEQPYKRRDKYNRLDRES
jgi:hypothetical protein